jgi:hypothetical protein
MPLVSEFLNGGIVTVRDPTLLKEGELQQADECVYRAHDPALYRAPGRTAYNSTSIKDSSGADAIVKGLLWLPFGNGRTDQMLVLAGNNTSLGALWTSDFTTVAGTASFTRVTGPGRVTDATINNSTTVTSPSGGFTYMVPGARVSGTGFPANAVVTVVTNSTTITIAAATTGGPQVVTATFDMGIAVAPSDLGDEILDGVHWGNSYFVFDGYDPLQRVFYKTRTIPGSSLSDLLIARPAGLDPITVQPTVEKVAGTWPAVLGNGYFWFLITEGYDMDQDDEVEGTYTPLGVNGVKLGPVVIQITDYTTQTVKITRPTQVNDGSRGRLSNVWNIYMSPKQDDNTTVPALSTFRRVAVVTMSETKKTLTDTSTTTNPTQSKYVGAVATPSGRTPFNNPSNMIGSPNNVDSANNLPGRAELLQNFGFSTSAPYASPAVVTGVQVTAWVRSVFVPATVTITMRTTAGKTAISASKTIGTNYVTWTFGGQFDTSGVAWSPSDFADGTFEILIEQTGTSGVFPSLLNVDAVNVTVYYSGGSIDLNGRAFRIVTYRDQVGTVIEVPAKLPPPIPSTGDIFMGSVVLNDIADEASLCWSLPGDPESYPAPYRLKFSERRRNKVTFIRRVGQVLVAGLQDAVKRVNYLPSEVDTDFQEGLAHEDLASDHGIVGPLAGCLFTMPGGGGAMLAYIAQNGLHVTDGVTTRFLNLDLAWTSLVDTANMSRCVLRNYPREQWIVLFYPPAGGSGKNTRAIIFPYSQDKIKEGGMMPAVGPVSVSSHCATVATLNGQHYLFTGHQTSGFVYTEDSGLTIPAGYTTDGTEIVIGAPRILTRRFYMSGIDMNTREERIYVHYASTGTLVVTANCTFVKGSAIVTMTSTTGIVKGMLVVTSNVVGDSIVLSVDSSTQITISTYAFESGVFSTGFDNSTFAVTVRRQNIGEVPTSCETVYSSMRVGALSVVHPDNQGQAMELRIDKMVMPDASRVDAGVNMRLNFFAYDAAPAGKEQNRVGT